MDDWAIERLGTHHETGSFDCGTPSLSNWLRQNASQFEKRDLARVLVLVRAGTTNVVGYYSLTNTAVKVDDFPPAATKRLPRIPIPAVLIGKLAIDLTVQGQGLGAFLLMNAFSRIQHTAEHVGIRAVIVDALDETARRFYLHHGFHELLDDPNHMFIPLEVIRKLKLPPLISG